MVPKLVRFYAIFLEEQYSSCVQVHQQYANDLRIPHSRLFPVYGAQGSLSSWVRVL